MLGRALVRAGLPRGGSRASPPPTSAWLQVRGFLRGQAWAPRGGPARNRKPAKGFHREPIAASIPTLSFRTMAPSPLPKKLCQELVAAAFELERRAPWHRFMNEDAMVVYLPGDDQPFVVSIMGAALQEFGLVCYRGPRVLAAFRRFAHGEGDRAGVFDCEMFSMSLSAPRDVAPELREIAAIAGHSARIIPAFLAKLPGRDPTVPSKAMLKQLLAILRIVNSALDSTLLRPTPIRISGPARLMVLQGSIVDRRLAVRIRIREFAIDEAPGAPPDAFEDLAGLPSTTARWVVGLRMPTGIRLSDSTRPMCVLVADEQEQKILAANFVNEDDLAAAGEVVIAAMTGAFGHGEAALPQHITFTSQGLHQQIQGGLEFAGVSTSFTPTSPLLDDIEAELARHLAGATGDREQPQEERPTAAVLERARRHRQWNPSGPRLRERFFVEDGDYGPFAEGAFELWYLLFHRIRDGSRTIAERLLEGTLPDVERQRLEALRRSEPGMWQIEGAVQGVVELRDVLTDRRHSVVDLALAQSDLQGAALPGLVFAEGDETLFVPLAAPIPPGSIDDALEFLDEGSDEQAETAVRESPELLGHLWWWQAGHTRPMPSLTNTDGDALALQTATFRATDRAALVAALSARSDVETDDEDGTDAWRWFRESGEMRTSLARLHLIGDELLVEVNSNERLSRMRGWLDAVLGVAFLRTRLEDLGAPIPDDDRVRPLASSLAPEGLAALQEHIDTMVMRWPDESVPALGGLTPRAAVRDPKLRPLVERMIRTYPDPGGIPGLRIPRERLRRELGLDSAEAEG